MKKIIVPKDNEESKFFCDHHPDRECFGQLKMNFWYGSQHDMTEIEIHLCDECLEEMYKLLEKEFKIKPKDIEL